MGKITEFLRGKTIFMTGATGFLGQPLVEKILWSAPDVKRIYVLIRPKHRFGGRVVEAQERLEKELYGSSAFDRLQLRHQGHLDEFLREKLVAVAGDISAENLGIEEEELQRLLGEVDVVINSAAVVSFDAPLDQSLELNVFGAKRMAEFAIRCEKAILVHVSTAYVCGAAIGDVPETLHHSAPADCQEEFPVRQFTDIDREVEKIRELVEEVLKEVESPEVKRRFTEAFVKRNKKWAGRKRIQRRQEIEKLKKKWLSTRLSEKGMQWARERGWNDTYTFTKALGEQFVNRLRGSLPTAIVRPSVIESSLSEPSPGWLDGLRMADPLIVAIGKGRLRSLPLNPDVSLDLVPADMVVNAILAVMPLLEERPEDLKILQVATGSKNPITLGELYVLILRYFRGNPMLDKDGQPIFVKSLRFPKPATFRLQHRLRDVPLGTAERTLERLKAFDATQKARRKISATRAAYEKLYYYGEIYEPYLNLNCRFLVDKTLGIYSAMDEAEQREFNFDVTRLNWRHYVQNVHIPGVKKFILKIEGTGTLELPEEAEAERLLPSTIRDLLDRAVERDPKHVALQMKDGKKWIRYTFKELAEAADDVAGRLLSLGLRKGDRVVLYAENQPEWGVCYLGAATIGLTVVPIDSQTWHREAWSVAQFTEAKALLISEKCFEKLPKESLELNEQAANPVWLLNVGKLAQPYEIEELPRSTSPKVSSVPPRPEWPEVSADDTASIIFTTGTAVDPKGAVHTHRNFLNNLRGVIHYLAVTEQDQLLSVLPLYHALEFTCGFLGAIYGGASVTYATSLKPRVILETMRETGVTCMLGVPTLYALMREDIERRVLKTSKSTFKTNLMATSKQISQSWEKRTGKNIGRQLFSRVNAEFGGKTRFFVSGGSALGEDLYRDFRSMGMTIYEGYGLTETAPVLTVNPLHRSREGAAGKPLPGVEVRLYHPDGDGIGEIIVRSPSLMREYYKNPKATQAVIRDGWFHTGDLGWVDPDGYIYITGRIKNVIVTGAGKNVYPTDVEATYGTLPEIEEICVFGLKSGLTEDVHAVVYPNRSVVDGSDPEEIKKTVQKSMQQLARQLPSYHRLQALHVWDEPLPRDGAGELDRVAIEQLITEGRSPSNGAPTRKPGKRLSRRESLLTELSRLSGLEVEEIGEDTNLYSDLGLDSLMAVELLLFLEREFGVTVSDDRVSGFQTVGDVLDELRKRGVTSGKAGTGPASAQDRSLVVKPQRVVDRALLGASFSTLKSFFRAYFDLTLAGQEFIPKDGAYIIAANHASHLDTAAVVASLSIALGVKKATRLHVIGARDYFFNSPFKSWFFSSCLNVVPIERDEISLNGLRQVGAILGGGEPVLIFPEGTRSRSGELQEFKPGIGLIALEVGVPILPAFIEGTYAALPAGKAVPRRSQVKVRFGEPITPEAYRESADGVLDENYRRIAEDTRRAVETLGKR